MVLTPFQLPSELLLSALCAQFPCRDAQIRSLTTLLSTYLYSPKNIVLHGLEATGKSSITKAVLLALCSNNIIQECQEAADDIGSRSDLRYAIVKSAECITGRHLLETIVGEIAKGVDWKESVGRCESLEQLAVEVRRLLDSQGGRGEAGEWNQRTKVDRKFVLVLDGVDKQKEAQPTLLAALARMGELIPNLTTIFIVTSPRPHLLHTIGVPHIHFPAYTKAEALQILSLDVPPIYNVSPSPPQASPSPVGKKDAKIAKESREVWSRFVSVVWDSLAKHSGRDIISLREICMKLWPSFTQPLRDGTYCPKDFSRLLVFKRTLFQDERVLVPSIVSTPAPTTIIATNDSTSQPKPPHTAQAAHRDNRNAQSITSQLPHTTRLLLIAAYLASYTPARTDTLLFMKSNAHLRSRKRKRSFGTPRAGPSKHRKIARKLLGPQAFVAERMLAIFWALVQNNDGGSGRIAIAAVAPGSADVPMAMATLASLRLLVRTSPAADVLDASTKWKVNVGWDVVRAVARSIGVEVEEYFWEE